MFGDYVEILPFPHFLRAALFMVPLFTRPPLFYPFVVVSDLSLSDFRCRQNQTDQKRDAMAAHPLPPILKIRPTPQQWNC